MPQPAHVNPPQVEHIDLLHNTAFWLDTPEGTIALTMSAARRPGIYAASAADQALGAAFTERASTPVRRRISVACALRAPEAHTT